MTKNCRQLTSSYKSRCQWSALAPIAARIGSLEAQLDVQSSPENSALISFKWLRKRPVKSLFLIYKATDPKPSNERHDLHFY